MTNTTPGSILRAADELFGTQGFEATSTRAIANASGTNLALIHYHFRGKEGLYRAVLDAHYARLSDVLASALAGSGTARERIHRLIDAYLSFLAANRGFSMMIQREATDPKRSAHIRERMRPMFRAAEQLAHDAFPASQGGALRAADLLVSFYGMIVTHVTYADFVSDLSARDPSDALLASKRHVHAMLDVVLDRLEKEST